MTPTEMARILGSRGGRARAARLPATEKRRIASLGGETRRLSIRAGRRIDENLAYAAAAEELRGGRNVVRRESTFQGRLPGLYPAES
ncbi:MAG: hypothetical protein R2862_03450 [Thermoanaerobaculia bacterium]